MRNLSDILSYITRDSIIFMFNSHKGNFIQRMCTDLSSYKILHAFHQTENEVQISGAHVTVLPYMMTMTVVFTRPHENENPA
jgi:hypothetical protein